MNADIISDIPLFILSVTVKIEFLYQPQVEVGKIKS